MPIVSHVRINVQIKGTFVSFNKHYFLLLIFTNINNKELRLLVLPKLVIFINHDLFYIKGNRSSRNE